MNPNMKPLLFSTIVPLLGFSLLSCDRLTPRAPSHSAALAFQTEGRDRSTRDANPGSTGSTATSGSGETANVTVAPRAQTSDVDITAYTYDQRGNFRETMESKLMSLENQISRLDNRLNVESPERHRRQMTELQNQYDQVLDQLEQAESTPQAEWNSYKTQFRSQVNDLEKSYQQMQTALGAR